MKGSLTFALLQALKQPRAYEGWSNPNKHPYLLLPFLWGWLHLLIHCDLFGLWVSLHCGYHNLEIVADLPMILYIVQNQVK